MGQGGCRVPSRTTPDTTKPPAPGKKRWPRRPTTEAALQPDPHRVKPEQMLWEYLAAQPQPVIVSFRVWRGGLFPQRTYRMSLSRDLQSLLFSGQIRLAEHEQLAVEVVR